MERLKNVIKNKYIKEKNREYQARERRKGKKRTPCSVMAGVVAYYICKWLDRNEDDN